MNTSTLLIIEQEAKLSRISDRILPHLRLSSIVVVAKQHLRLFSRLDPRSIG